MLVFVMLFLFAFRLEGLVAWLTSILLGLIVAKMLFFLGLCYHDLLASFTPAVLGGLTAVADDAVGCFEGSLARNALECIIGIPDMVTEHRTHG